MSEIHSNSKGHYEDEEDIFKSAIESPMTDSEKTILGEHEINLNDEDEDENIVDNLSSYVASNLKATDDGSDKEDSNRRSEEGNKNHIKPYQEQEQDANAPKSSTLSHTVEPKSNKVPFEMNSNSNSKAEGDTFDDQTQYIEITITEPQKQGEGMSGFIVYRVTTRTNIALFRRKEFAVWRRFSDFIGLHSKLAEKYMKKGRVVPPPPEKNMLGTTKIKIGGQNEPGTVTTQAEFIEKRRFGLERFLNRISGHPVLKVDPDFRDFLEIDSDLPKTSSSFSGAGVVRFFNRFGETVNKISYKMDEADPWFEEKIQNIEALENQLKKVHISLELLVNNRRDLALSTGTFAKSAAILSNAEEHTSLARCLAQLAEVEEKIEQIHHEQANSDFFLFAELLKDYLALIGSIKEVFYERVKTYQNWQHAQTMLNKKREIKAKLELQVKNDKIAQAREEVVEWESKVERNQEDFKSISIIIKKELEHFELTRVKEFKKIIVKYLESLLQHQQELVKYWESFLPEAKAIA